MSGGGGTEGGTAGDKEEGIALTEGVINGGSGCWYWREDEVAFEYVKVLDVLWGTLL